MVAMIMTNTRRKCTGEASPKLSRVLINLLKGGVGLYLEYKNKQKFQVPFAFSSSDFFLASTVSCAYVGFTAGALFKSDIP